MSIQRFAGHTRIGGVLNGPVLLGFGEFTHCVCEILGRVSDHYRPKIAYKVRHQQAAKKNCHERGDEKQRLKALGGDESREPFHNRIQYSPAQAALLRQGYVQSNHQRRQHSKSGTRLVLYAFRTFSVRLPRRFAPATRWRAAIAGIERGRNIALIMATPDAQKDLEGMATLYGLWSLVRIASK